MSNITIRKFKEEDIELKVNWINDNSNNKYLHYDLPLTIEKTKLWFESCKNKTNRIDMTIEMDGLPVGIIGLLGIDDISGEYYITIGEKYAKHKGVAKVASYLLLDYAFDTLKLNKVFLYTEVNNIPAQKLFERIGFIKLCVKKDSAYNRGKSVDRFYYEATKSSVKAARS